MNKSVVVAFAFLAALALPGLTWGDDFTAAVPILEGCKKKAAECKECNWGDCHPRNGFASDGCCSDGYQWKCCENAPKELTPCQKTMAKCTDDWGECFDRHAYNGDACCQPGAFFKCVNDMTMEERASKDPVYGQSISCILAGHPDWENLRKCMPNPSKCKSVDLCRYLIDYWSVNHIEKCPGRVKCLQRKHSDIGALLNCMFIDPSGPKEWFCDFPMIPF